MKKIMAIVLVAVMAAALFTGCETAAKAQPLKTGLGIVTSLTKSKDATADADGLAQTDSVVVAVLVDADGKIQNCSIDTAQTKINFSKDGKITSDKAASYPSKQELGANYGMAKASSIGKEWFEQANALATYVIGKTVDEVKGIAVSDEGKPTGTDLTSSVTMSITNYVAAIEKAVASAQDLGAKKGDKLGLGVLTTIDKSKDVAADAAGLAQAYSFYTATSFGADGKITSSVIDSTQGKVNFDATGVITSDLTAEVKTKNELGADYGMKSASKIGKEWNEQAAAFAKYVVGKTAADVAGIAVSEGKPTGTDLTSSVTVTISGFMTIIDKANTNAK